MALFESFDADGSGELDKFEAKFLYDKIFERA